MSGETPDRDGASTRPARGRAGPAAFVTAAFIGPGTILACTTAGAGFGYALLWAIVGAVLLGFMAQDMSARLGIFGDSLTDFMRRKLGRGGATAVALLLSVGCVAGGLELTAAVGKGISPGVRPIELVEASVL